MFEIKIKLTHPLAKIPTEGSANAACWDVYAAEINQITNDCYQVNLGFQLEPPPGFKVVLVPRSSITKTSLIQQNSPGQGDEDYRGEYKYIFRMLPSHLHKHSWSDSGIYIKSTERFPPHIDNNCYLRLAYNEFPYKVGDRIGQIFLEKIIPIQFMQVDNLSETERGEGGFGSTGK